ncbi:MAG: nucleoside-diphosphate-sugar epimerase [Myxococcota bacterium]|jgi:nucleoside-diphosphate-sugar epimerase
MGERIFVTGASGRVGRPLVTALAEAGHEVIGLARSEDKARTVRDAGARDCVIGDLKDEDVLRTGAAGASRIYHLAGGARGPGQVTPDVLNNQGTRHLISALSGRDDIERVVFTSTCAVYGDRVNLWVPEDMPPTPNTRYGTSKVDAEQALIESGLPVVLVRLAAVYGPGFPFMMTDRIEAGRCWLPGEGRNYVPTIHVEDAVRGLVLLGERGELGAAVHLSDPDPIQLKDFYAAIHQHVGGEPVKFWSTWVPSYVQRTAARYNERVQSRLGRRPQFTPDNLKLFTSSVRLRVETLEKRLSFTWRYPNATVGLAATLGNPSRG